MSYTNGLDNPELYFQNKLYTGNGSNNHAITLDGDENMQPDMIWTKNRGSSTNHFLMDSVRGTEVEFRPNDDNHSAGDGSLMDSFDSNGFTLDESVSANDGSETYAAHCWKESATSGFDIVSYTGNGSARTISHSLSAVPKFIAVKRRDTGGNSWVVYHDKMATTVSSGQIISSSSEDYTLALDTTAAKVNETLWNDTAPTSSVFSVGTADGVNGNTYTYIAYLFAEKSGFSKFSSYIGNENANGTFIHTGFKPSFVMIKRTDASTNWYMFDNKRFGYNGKNAWYYANTTNSENAAGGNIHLLSNGFKIVNSETDINEDGGSYPHSGSAFIYVAFAEAPFCNSSGVPNNAR